MCNISPPYKMSAQAQSEFIRWVSDSQQSFLYTRSLSSRSFVINA
ncbi:hypothetical protein B194_5071 [Serratia plymuthica A30]|nr:hypothetical protein B194_5071 [Serratia plymuthica A30]